MLEHYGLVFPVEQADLAEFMQVVRVHGDGPDLALGTRPIWSRTAAGSCAFSSTIWRPAARGARLDDRYGFDEGRRPVALRQIYDAYRQQLFMPASVSQLPRLRLGFASPGGSVRSVEADAYNFLRLLIELEPDASLTWVNRAGQPLSVELLMSHVREHYLVSRTSAARPRDHSNLHLVELLVAFESRAHAGELEAVKQHFLAGALAQYDFEPEDAGFVLAHYVESLGHLLEASDVRWREDEKRRVRRWLEDLEEHRLRDVPTEDPDSLCHLTKGLRSVRAQRAELE